MVIERHDGMVAGTILTEGKVLTVGAGFTVVADLVVLDRDILICPHEEIAAIAPLLTMLGGRTVYEA